MVFGKILSGHNLVFMNEPCKLTLFLQNASPLGVYAECCKKKKECCKNFKKGDRCKKCPGRK
jgi:hypothetical protein